MNILLTARRATLLSSLVLALAGSAAAQDPLPSRTLAYVHDTGTVVNAGQAPEIVASFQVHVDEASWLRLYFSDLQLAGHPRTNDASILRITSYLDGATQELNVEHAAQWSNSSAYFNGDTVQVEILAQPGSGANRAALARVDAGVAPPGGPKTQCGPTDNRTPSSDPRSCRAMPVGCTAWMINDCAHCFLTAGHCCCSSLQVMEFNVPFSNANGSVVHPPPQDQYAIDVASRQSRYTGIGDDYTYFGCHPNSNTGKTPYEAQGAAYDIALPPVFNPSVIIRITGYGVDSTPNGTYNQIQQTSTGPYFAFGGTTLQYQCDTEGGNSGSAVQWDNGGVAIGIHTNGGCSTSGSGANSGTGLNNSFLQTALNNPLGVCRVVASASTYCTAKVNSIGCTPVMSFVGSPAFGGGAGSFLLDAAQMMNNKSGLLFYGFQSSSAPFGGGTLCVGGALKRTAVQNSGGSASGQDCTGTYSFDMSALIAAGTEPAFVCGGAAFTQYWARDPGFAPPDNISMTNAVRFVIGP